MLLRPVVVLLLLWIVPGPVRADLFDDLIEQGKVHRQAKNPLEAFDCFERVIRTAETMGPKRKARDEIFAMGPIPAREMNDGEKALVASRIKDEKVRHFRDVIGRLNGRKKFHGVRTLRLAILDNLEDDGAADRERQAIKDLEFRMVRELDAKDKAEYEKTIAANKGEALAKAAAFWRAKGKRVLAAELMREYDYRLPGDDPKREKAQAEIREIEQEHLAAVPEDEKKEAEAAIRHRAWADLTTTVSHHFIYIGDKGYVPRIPPKSMLELDLAYIFITDLLENNPDADGQRITIFFKELWDFGGGIGGGKTIDIGRVDIKAPSITVSNFLFFHELCHCLFDTAMIYDGFVEGVANFGATFAYDALGYRNEAENGFKSNYGQFVKDYLGRDVRFWRIQPYGPSCGFWLHFIQKYGKEPDGLYDWCKYRKFFRLWRRYTIRTERTTEKIRYFGSCLAECFGPGVIEDLREFRFPVLPDELSRVQKEVEDLWPKYQEGFERLARKEFEGALESLKAVADTGAESEVVALAREAMLHAAHETGDEATLKQQREALGLIMDWKLCGPFYSAGVLPLHDVFAPEWEIDYAKEYPSQYQIAKWWDAKPRYDGEVRYEFHYPQNAAAYALAYLDVPTDTDGYVFVGSDDMHGLWVNRQLIEKRDVRRGVMFDHDRYPVSFRRGLNVLLLKIGNGGGDLGFVLRVTDRKGRAIPALRVFTANRDAELGAAPLFKAARRVYLEEFHNRATLQANWITGCGSWKIQNKMLSGTDTKRNALWRKFLVTPGQEKDAPANMLWLKPKLTGGVRDLQIDMDLRMAGMAYPKFTVTLDGEGENDGLSGLTLIFLPIEEGVDVRFEWYDKIMYYRRVKLPQAKEYALAVSRESGFVSVVLNGVSVFDRVSMPVLRSGHVGFATYGLEPGVTRFALSAGK